MFLLGLMLFAILTFIISYYLSQKYPHKEAPVVFAILSAVIFIISIFGTIENESSKWKYTKLEKHFQNIEILDVKEYKTLYTVVSGPNCYYVVFTDDGLVEFEIKKSDNIVGEKNESK